MPDGDVLSDQGVREWLIVHCDKEESIVYGPAIGASDEAVKVVPAVEVDRLRAENERLKAPEGWEDELNAAWATVNQVRAENERLKSDLEWLRGRFPSPVDQPCGCTRTCGDDGDIDGPGTCKDLPMKREPLVEVVVVPRSRRSIDEIGASDA